MTKISKLFEKKPGTWGLRGDGGFWFELKDKIGHLDLPESEEELIQILYKNYELILGKSIESKNRIFKEEYNYGGMSGGSVSPDFWLTKGFPYIVDNYKTICSIEDEVNTPLSKKVDSKVVLVTNFDDWEALFVNGEVKIQAHSIDRKYLVKYCLEYNTMYCVVGSSSDELDLSGEYPYLLDDIIEYQDILLAVEL